MYPILLRKVFCEPWACHEATYGAIQDILLDASEHGVPQNRVVMAQVPFTPIALGLGLKSPADRGSRLFTKGSLGVIPIRGVIGSHLSGIESMCGGYGIEQLSADLDSAAEDPSIKRVLLDFHSPGGTITGIPEAARQIRGMTKPTFGFTSGQSASASYWLMSQCQNVYLTESASVGSIGVYLAALDTSKARAAKGEQLQIFKAGKHKAMGVGGGALTDDDKALLQATVDKAYEKFTSQVKSARPKISNDSMQGQMFVGADARDAKLVDSLVTSLGSLVNRLS